MEKVHRGSARYAWRRCKVPYLTRVFAAVDATLELPDPDSDDAWYSFVAKINKSLDELHLDFRRVVDESTGKHVYILVCSHSRFSPSLNHLNIE